MIFLLNPHSTWLDIIIWNIIFWSYHVFIPDILNWTCPGKKPMAQFIYECSMDYWLSERTSTGKKRKNTICFLPNMEGVLSLLPLNQAMNPLVPGRFLGDLTRTSTNSSRSNALVGRSDGGIFQHSESTEKTWWTPWNKRISHGRKRNCPPPHVYIYIYKYIIYI